MSSVLRDRFLPTNALVKPPPRSGSSSMAKGTEPSSFALFPKLIIESFLSRACDGEISAFAPSRRRFLDGSVLELVEFGRRGALVVGT